jgi:tetratricopeptide (TPR) repeat protein
MPHPDLAIDPHRSLRRHPKSLRVVASSAACLAAALLLLGCGSVYRQNVERGQSALAQGRYEEALNAFEAARALEPQGQEANQGVNDARVKLYDAWTTRALAASRAGDHLTALDLSRSLQGRFPVESSALVQEVAQASIAHADTLLLRAQDPEAALSLLDAISDRLPSYAPQIDPKRQQAKRAVITLLAEQARADAAASRYPEAIQKLDRALGLSPPADRAALDLQRLEVARAWAAALVQQAQAASARQDFAAALQSLDRAHALLPAAERAEVERLQHQARLAWADQHVRHAQDLRQQRLYPEAIASLDAALALLSPPDDVPVRALLSSVRLDWAVATERQAQAAAQSKDYPLAVALYAQAIERAPDAERPPIQSRRLALQRVWADDLISLANTLAAQTRYPDALAALSSPDLDLPDAERARLAAAAERIQVTWADGLSENAHALLRQGLSGAAFASATHAVDIAPPHLRARYAAQRDQAHRALLQQAQVAVLIRGATLSRDELDTLRAAIDSRRGGALLSFAPTSAPPDALTLDLDLNLSTPRFDERITHVEKTVTFQSGVLRSDNPAHAALSQQHQAALDDLHRLKADEVAATERLRALEGRVKLLSAHPKPPVPSLPSIDGDAPPDLATPEDILALLKHTQAEVKAQEHALSALKPKHKHLADEVKNLKSKLAETPAVSEQPQQSALTYRVTHHALRATLDLTATLVDQRLSYTAARDYADDTHPPQPAIDLPADPLEVPPQEQLTRDLRADALARLPDLVLSGFESYRRALTQRASGARSDAERLHLLMLYALLNPRETSLLYPPDLDRLSGLQDTLSLVIR